MSAPFLKWLGGKRRSLPILLKRLPSGQRLVEPFIGGAAVFMGTDYEAYLLADLNPDLIELYRIVQEGGPAFIDYAATYFTDANNEKHRYYSLRERFNEINHTCAGAAPNWERAALFVYLNRYGYNGLVRYNSAGGFNAPFGRYTRPYFPRREMEAFTAKSRERAVEFVVADFRTTFGLVRVGDVVYCDPPYKPISRTANFTTYTADGFSTRDQEDLVALAGASPVPVVISNHADRDLVQSYRNIGARVHYHSASRFVSCNGGQRVSVREVIAVKACA